MSGTTVLGNNKSEPRVEMKVVVLKYSKDAYFVALPSLETTRGNKMFRATSLSWRYTYKVSTSLPLPSVATARLDSATAWLRAAWPFWDKPSRAESRLSFDLRLDSGLKRLKPVSHVKRKVPTLKHEEKCKFRHMSTLSALAS